MDETQSKPAKSARITAGLLAAFLLLAGASTPAVAQLSEEEARQVQEKEMAEALQLIAQTPREGYYEPEAAGFGPKFTDADHVKEYRKKAELGADWAMHDLALAHEQGRGMEKPDFGQAVQWYFRAAAQGDEDSMLSMALIYFEGKPSVKQDHKAAAMLFDNAAARWNAAAQLNLALCAQVGLGMPKNHGEFLKWLHCAVEQDEPRAVALMKKRKLTIEMLSFRAWQHRETEPARQPLPKVVPATEEQIAAARSEVQQGDAETKVLTLYNLAILLLSRTDRDEASVKEAVECFRKSAELGLSTAAYELGVHYLLGLGVAKDASQAMEWFHRAADDGYLRAYEKLAQGLEFNWNPIFVLGNSNSDAETSVRYLRIAAEARQPWSAYRLARRYEKGEGVREDLDEAFSWMNRAAQDADAVAGSLEDFAGRAHIYADLARYHEMEIRLDTTDATALRLYAKAIAQGDERKETRERYEAITQKVGGPAAAASILAATPNPMSGAPASAPPAAPAPVAPPAATRATTPMPSSAPVALTFEDVASLLQAGVTTNEILPELNKRGYSGPVDGPGLAALKKAGADVALLLAVKKAAR